MSNFANRSRAYLWILLTLIFSLLLNQSIVFADENEPIAYTGHGGFFDQKGQQIVLTPEFVAKAQDWYRTKLLSALKDEKRAEFAKFETRLNLNIKAEGQAHLIVQQTGLKWLAANIPDSKDNFRIRSKLNALQYALKWKLADKADLRLGTGFEIFKLDPRLEKSLKKFDFGTGNLQVLSATTNKGQDYINECIAAEVPIPPPIGQMDPAGLAGWKIQGDIPTASQFIFGTPAEVRSFESPKGMCIALPRYTNATKMTVALDGVICLSKVTSKVCFWDNQMNKVGFSFPSGTQIPIGVPNLAINPAGLYQAGGFELEGGSGDVCTDCHAGQNPYIIHPKVNLGSVLMGSLPLPTFSPSRYDPLVPASWPQNQLSHSLPLVPAVCAGCHNDGGSGGAFPHLSSELPGYCTSVLQRAIGMINLPAATMPPGSGAGSLVTDPLVIAFKNWCNSAASTGPSNRGDPHLTTTNGINYDFQSGGEFTALRNSATQFELQTRQTPVSTTFTPGANPYTGLASCVSLNTAAAIRLGKHRVTYQPPFERSRNSQRLQLRIDGVLTVLPAAGINFGDGNTISAIASGEGLDIKSSDGTHVIISSNFWSSQGYWYLNIEVLNTPAREGTMGHIPTGNWLPLAPNGSSFGPAPGPIPAKHALLNKKFANAWRVTNTNSLFDYSPGTSTKNFTNREWPAENGACKIANATTPPVEPMSTEKARQICSAIKDKVVFESCVFDLSVTGEAGMLKAYLQTLRLRENAVAAPNP